MCAAVDGSRKLQVKYDNIIKIFNCGRGSSKGMIYHRSLFSSRISARVGVSRRRISANTSGRQWAEFTSTAFTQWDGLAGFIRTISGRPQNKNLFYPFE
jgi:hypothetical protein